MELGKRAVKAKGWRWMSGMLPLAIDNDGDWTPSERVWRTQGGRLALPPGAIPDLSDPATLGCLLALVREAWDMPRINTFCADGWWSVHSPLLNIGFPIRDKKNNSEAAALVRALERAPLNHDADSPNNNRGGSHATKTDN